MTEKEKMITGQPYFAGDDKLYSERAACKMKCAEYNSLKYTDWENRTKMLLDILGSADSSICIEQPFICDYGYQISVGKNLYMNHGCIILDGGGVSFGNNVMVGPQCGFHTAGHPLDSETRNRGIEYTKPIKIGDDVWIGAGVHVMPGVTIGSNTVIGGGSVVTKDIPSGVLAAGNPCKVIRKI